MSFRGRSTRMLASFPCLDRMTIGATHHAFFYFSLHCIDASELGYGELFSPRNMIEVERACVLFVPAINASFFEFVVARPDSIPSDFSVFVFHVFSLLFWILGKSYVLHFPVFLFFFRVVGKEFLLTLPSSLGSQGRNPMLSSLVPLVLESFRLIGVFLFPSLLAFSLLLSSFFGIHGMILSKNCTTAK